MRAIALTALSALLLVGCDQATPTPPDEIPPTEYEQAICPEGTQPVGHAPPLGAELACALPNGDRHGPYSQWYPDGKLKASGAFKNGEKHGLWQSYYHRTGGKQSEGHYASGARDGIWSFFSKRGKVAEEAHFKKGALVDMKKLNTGP